jgi:hypothetical protein
MRAIGARGRDADFGPLEAVRCRGGSDIASMGPVWCQLDSWSPSPSKSRLTWVIEGGQCCRQLTGVKQGAGHHPGKGEGGARLQFGVNPPGEDPPAR